MHLPWARADTVAVLNLLPSISSCRICSANSWLDGFLLVCMDTLCAALKLEESGKLAECLCPREVSKVSVPVAVVKVPPLEATTPKEGLRDDRSIVDTAKRLI